MDEKLTVSLQKYENNFENFKIFMQINPLFKQLADVYQNSELISIIKKIPNNPLDNLIRIIQQIQVSLFSKKFSNSYLRNFFSKN